MTGTDEVVIERRAGFGAGLLQIQLNRPRALNALTLAMIHAIEPALRAAEGDPAIACVVIEGAGDRAFCAGGDVRAVAESLKDPSARLAQDFFRAEYRLNWRIHRYGKPFIALIDGVSMGGGVGLSVHGSHRVITEKLTFAMPETGIGLFPDVGATWFLTRCPGEIGTYLALTGARLKAADALYCGYGTHFVPSGRLPGLREELFAAAPSSSAAVDAMIARFVEPVGLQTLPGLRDAIDRCFAGDSVEAILLALDREGGAWATETASVLRDKSPTSLKVTLRQLRGGKGLTIEDALIREYRMSQHCMAGHDFAEGIRAVLIDKDQRPVWRPATLAEVDDAVVAGYFAPLGPQDLRFDE